jgi:hypothetical protein
MSGEPSTLSGVGEGRPAPPIERIPGPSNAESDQRQEGEGNRTNKCSYELQYPKLDAKERENASTKREYYPNG